MFKTSIKIFLFLVVIFHLPVANAVDSVVRSTPGDLNLTTVTGTGGGVLLNSRQTGVGLFVNTSNNVGIGTASPTAALEVKPSTIDANVTALRLTSSDGGFVAGQELQLDFNQLGAQAARIAMTYFASADWGFNFYGTGQTNPIMTMRGSGNVGIGTASPADKLTVATPGASGAIGIDVGTGSLADMKFLEGGTRKWAIRKEVNNGLTLFTDASNTNKTFQIQGDTGSNLFQVNTQTGAVTIPGNLTVSGSCTGCGGGTINAGNVSSGAFGSNTGGGNYSFPGTLTATGNIYGANLTLSTGNIVGAPNQELIYNSNYGRHTWIANGTERFRIETNGNTYFSNSNVGIGDSAPGYALTVKNDSNANLARFYTTSNYNPIVLIESTSTSAGSPQLQIKGKNGPRIIFDNTEPGSTDFAIIGDAGASFPGKLLFEAGGIGAMSISGNSGNPATTFTGHSVTINTSYGLWFGATGGDNNRLYQSQNGSLRTSGNFMIDGCGTIGVQRNSPNGGFGCLEAVSATAGRPAISTWNTQGDVYNGIEVRGGGSGTTVAFGVNGQGVIGFNTGSYIEPNLTLGSTQNDLKITAPDYLALRGGYRTLLGGTDTQFIAGNAPVKIEQGGPDSSLYVTSGGNIGINTTVPATKLEVNSNATGDTTALSIRNGNTAQSDSVSIGFNNTYANTYIAKIKGYVGQTGNNGGALALQVRNGNTGAYDTGISVVSNNNGGGYLYINNNGFGGTPSLDLAVGDTDTGIKWISDGNFALYGNNQNLASFTGAGSPSIAFNYPVSAPTATAGTNTTQVATTAFVQAAVSGASGAITRADSTSPANLVNPNEWQTLISSYPQDRYINSIIFRNQQDVFWEGHVKIGYGGSGIGSVTQELGDFYATLGRKWDGHDYQNSDNMVITLPDRGLRVPAGNRIAAWNFHGEDVVVYVLTSY